MNRQERIISLLTQAFEPTFLELHDESTRHAGHAGATPGGESHYRLTIQSPKFKGLNRIERHQAIYRALAAEFASGLHALSIQTEE